MVRFRKSKKFGPFNVTLSKSGVSGSVGAGGVRMKLFGGRGREAAKGDNHVTSGGCVSTLAMLFLIFLGMVFAVGYLTSPGETPSVAPQQPPQPVAEVDPPRESPPVEAEPLLAYDIISHNEVKPHKVSYDVRVDLVDGQLPTEEQLAAISNHLVGSLPHESKFVGFYLPDMVVDSGYFATAHHLPTLEVKINSGLLPDKYKSLPSGSKEPAGPYRTWSSSNGKFTTEARLIDRTGDTALLMRRDKWKTLSVPLVRLSEDDTKYVAADSWKVLEGKVISIADGDTLTLRDGENHKIRLEGIDSPEKGQDYGTQSRKALGEYVHGKTIRVRWSEKDKYGRILGHVIADEKWVNLELVNAGWAWHYKKYSDDPDLAEAERLARENKRGLWADPNQPESPWDYRARPKHPTPSASPLSATASPQESHWLNTNSNVRHNSGCKYFRNTKHGKPCTSNDGKPCGICGG